MPLGSADLNSHDGDDLGQLNGYLTIREKFDCLLTKGLLMTDEGIKKILHR